jgi:urease accessory protein
MRQPSIFLAWEPTAFGFDICGRRSIHLRHGIALAPALQAYLQAFAANLVSAAMRLIPLGQTAGLCLVAGLEPVIADVAEEAMTAALAALGGSAVRADLASMNHEIQETRLFRT